MEITLTLTGNKQMLLHNGRLSNPIDPYTRRVKEITAKRKKTDEDIAELALREARGGVYETATGQLGLPVDNVWRALYDAAKAYKQGANVQRALLMLSDVEPLLIDGKPIDDIDAWLIKPGSIDMRPVRNQMSRVLRSRALVPSGWTSVHRFELLEDVLDFRELEPIVSRAGRLHGVGDFRPRYGTFTAEMEVVN